MMGFGLVVFLLIGGVVLVAILGGLGVVSRKGTETQWLGGQRQPAARQVLDERFARGEISSNEYETIRAQLER
jgi:uncharacterized membrane protein